MATLSSVSSFIVSVATVALIVFSTRWIFGATGALLPITHNGSSLYRLKWQWPALGYAGVAFCVAMSIWSWRDLHSPDWTLIIFSVIFALMGLWLGSGAVTTNQSGITKKVLWHSRSFRWDEVTEIRLHKNDGGAIDLRAGGQKLIIDVRFVARQHLLTEIIARTKLQPIGRLP